MGVFWEARKVTIWNANFYFMCNIVEDDFAKHINSLGRQPFFVILLTQGDKVKMRPPGSKVKAMISSNRPRFTFWTLFSSEFKNTNISITTRGELKLRDSKVFYPYFLWT